MYRTILLLSPRAALLHQCCRGSYLFFACGELPAKDLFKVAWVLRQSTGSCLYRIHICRLCMFRCQNVRCNVLLVWCDFANASVIWVVPFPLPWCSNMVIVFHTEVRHPFFQIPYSSVSFRDIHPDSSCHLSFFFCSFRMNFHRVHSSVLFLCQRHAW